MWHPQRSVRTATAEPKKNTQETRQHRQHPPHQPRCPRPLRKLAETRRHRGSLVRWAAAATTAVTTTTIKSVERRQVPPSSWDRHQQRVCVQGNSQLIMLFFHHPLALTVSLHSSTWLFYCFRHGHHRYRWWGEDGIRIVIWEWGDLCYFSEDSRESVAVRKRKENGREFVANCPVEWKIPFGGKMFIFGGKVSLNNQTSVSIHQSIHIHNHWVEELTPAPI